LKEASSEIALLQRNILLEKENQALRKKLLVQKIMLLDYKNTTEAQLKEAKIREERLIRDNEEFKKEMKQQVSSRFSGFKSLIRLEPFNH